ncbi:glycosyltransferase family 8 protein [Paracoccus fontiphilus]|uniref:Glycosyltransferase family 8 protein n=1 Tax=Paracoccus fontiphilus TaxID=1815556 RepID=A0ABV7I9J5_9RHOB
MRGDGALPAAGTDRPDPVHVLFCANGAYLQHAAVAAVSLLEASAGSPVVIHVMMMQGDPEAQAMMAWTVRHFPNARIEFHRIDDRRISGAFVDRYLSSEAYLRFLAPEVLSPAITRVIYLDCDLVVLDDLRRLWRVELGGRAVGAVAECDWMNGSVENRLTRLGIGRGHVYVNSGVLLMDLERWRGDRLADRLFDVVAARGPMLQFHDQDALNMVLQGDIALLDRRWNVQVLMFGRWMRKALPADYEATREARRDPGIIHYTTANKPWLFRSWTRKRALYYRYLDRTAWRHVPPPLPGRAARLEHRLSRALLRIGLDPYALLPVWKRVRRSVSRI